MRPILDLKILLMSVGAQKASRAPAFQGWPVLQISAKENLLESEGSKPKYFIHLWDTTIPYCYLSCICHFGWVYQLSFQEIT